MLASIYILPPEVIANIFAVGKEMEDEANCRRARRGKPANLPFELLATQISSYFRQISLASPRLWTSIKLHADCHVDHIAARLERSCACELDIRIEIGEEDAPISPYKLDVLLSLIIPYSTQWRTLFFRYGCEIKKHPVVRRVTSAPAPNLQFLSLSVANVNQIDIALKDRTVLMPHMFDAGTPKLNFVRLRGLAIQFFRPPIFALVTLHLEVTSYFPILYSTLHEILTTSPFLEHLSIHGDIISPGSWPSSHLRRLSIPTLRSLRLFSESGGAYCGIMNILDTPNLESLTLKSLHEHDLDPFLSNHYRSAEFHNVTFLNFIDFDFTVHTYKRIFEVFQNVTSFFNLCVPIGENGAIKLLSEGQITNNSESMTFIPWPKLETLGVGGDISYDLEFDIMDTMLAARRKCGFPISSITFAVDDDDDDDDVTDELDELEGWDDMKLSICPVSLSWPDIGNNFDHEDTLF